MLVQQHIPHFIEGLTPERTEVATLEELLALPWVRRWEPATWMRSLLPDIGCALLMAIVHEAGAPVDQHWVIAYVRPPEALDALPLWTHDRCRPPERDV
jgi:hypothetical protein